MCYELIASSKINIPRKRWPYFVPLGVYDLIAQRGHVQGKFKKHVSS